MSEHRRPPAYRAFIVRIWPSEPQSHDTESWRAQLVDVRTGESQSFRDPIKLAAFLYAKGLINAGADEVVPQHSALGGSNRGETNAETDSRAGRD